MRRRAPKVSLSAEQRDDLERFSRSRTLEARLVERSRIVLQAAAGQDNWEIAEAVGLCRQTVGHWRECFVAEGIHGLEDRPRSGRPARILAPTINEIVRLTTQSTPVAATHWSTRTLAAETQVSFSTIGRIWRGHGLKPPRIERFKLRNDPRFGEKLQDVVPLYLHPPEGAVVISVDEKCQIQALQRTQPGLPWKKGRCGTMTHDYKRHGTTTLFAGMNVADGTVIVSVRPTPHRACCPGVSVRGCRDDVSGKICPEKCGMLGQLLGPQAVAQVLKSLWESVFGEQKGLA